MPGGEWKLTTNKGEITAEHVVLCTGNYARQTGRMFGLNMPAIPVEHQYIVYDESPELKAYRQSGGRELAVLREPDQSYYFREERMGWILGPYEAGAPARFADGVPSWFGKDLFPGELERLLPHVEAAQRRVPGLERCGIKDIVNGPIAYTPDGSPLVGPAWGKRNLWINEGHSFGITAAGGAGWQLAEWIVEGEPGIDMLAVDPRRFGGYTSKRYLVAKNEEAYRDVFTIHYPDEERHDARPAKTSPVYDKLKRMGAVFGQRYGWERANWFAPEGVEPKDVWSFRRTQLLRARRQRVPPAAREGRRHRPDAVHQVRGDGPRCRSLARWPGRQQGADQGRPHRAVPCAHQAGRHPLRVHDHQARRAALLRRQRRRGRALRLGLPAEAPAGRRFGHAAQHHRLARRVRAGRSARPRRAWRNSPTCRSTTRRSPG